MRLRHITFTGIGTDTDISSMRQIQERFPLVEWGVLLSRSWRQNTRRYYDPSQLDRLRFSGLNLSLHVCGEVARQALNDNWLPLQEITSGQLGIFRRCQLNIGACAPMRYTASMTAPHFMDELILQQRSGEELDVFNTIRQRKGLSLLLDGSGGQGIDTGITPLRMPGVKVGYAGGISRENVKEKLAVLMGASCVEDTWIDMESSVRTDDRLDLKKCMSVLLACEETLFGMDMIKEDMIINTRKAI